MIDLIGKAALVTGGTRGIGAAIVRHLAGRGADVAFTFANAADKAAALVGEIEALGRRAVAIKADSGDPQAVRDAVSRAASELGRLDILVNNAGIFPSGPFEQVTLDEIDRTLAIHVRGAFVAAQTALAHMSEGGRIISIGSCFAQRVPYGGVTLYAMSKSALVGLTKGLAREVGARGITVNVVDPGSTDTDMNPADGPGVAAELDLMALRHYARPDDIAATVGHLAGPGGRFITGASIAVDGGFSA
ncbi:SDR family oxidoreductase [Starkeya sp. ORNL1]|uniref:SDR family NAD(P)-dependent oxidoreductase n=1 Tax=Starkeya sp. ORNL1 TaxID=2709380 RepID=UPI001462EA56|nr:SDR family oxidoreductase [Starkeya sp. ORNL1]QJP16030.1 SDR family oxidoreductase [Starkeya sp. ORNL1]